MCPHVLFVDFSADHSVRISSAEPGRRPPAAYLYQSHGLDDLDRALQDFLVKAGAPPLVGAAFSVCGWERDGTFEMPDHSYRIGRDWIKATLGINRLNLVNDCVAAALSIDRLKTDERVVISDGEIDPNQMKAMIAIGRSLGTTGILTDELGNPLAIPCAGGHSDLPATTPRESAVVQVLAAKYAHVSRVRAVSTAGLVEVHDALNRIDGRAGETITAADIVDRARTGEATAKEAVQLVTGWLAATASDTALMVGARGGIYLAGSFFDLLGDQFDAKAFAARFHDKGRLTTYLRDIPVFLVRTAEPEMLGLSTLFGR